VKIREVLSRRNDLSTFLVHLTRDFEIQVDGRPDEIPAKVSFEQIISERELRAVSPMGWAQEQDDADNSAKQTQRVVCFTETPLEHTWAMFEEIEDRERKVSSSPTDWRSQSSSPDGRG
jgi:hypothetical protein